MNDTTKFFRWELRREPDFDIVLQRGYVFAFDIDDALSWVRRENGLTETEPSTIVDTENLDALWAKWSTGKSLRIEEGQLQQC